MIMIHAFPSLSELLQHAENDTFSKSFRVLETNFHVFHTKVSDYPIYKSFLREIITVTGGFRYDAGH